MRVNVSTDVLANLVSAANSISKGGRAIRIVAEGEGGGAIGQVTVTSFLDSTVSAWRGEAEILEAGSIAVRGTPIETFLKTSSKSDKIVQLETIDVDNRSSLRIITTRGAHEFDGEPEQVFESIDPGRTNIELGNLSNLASSMKIAKTSCEAEAAAAGARLALSGVHIRPAENDFHVVGTDGKRLAMNSIHNTSLAKSDIPPEGITIPGKMALTVAAMIASEPSAIRVADNSLIVENASGCLSFSLLDVAYPEYPRLLNNQSEHTLSMKREDIALALERCSAEIGKEDRFVTATLSRDQDGVHLSSYTTQESSSEQLTEIGGEECEISFNVSYMKRAIANLDSKVVDISFKDVSNPMFLSSEDRPDIILLLMPCKSNAGR